MKTILWLTTGGTFDAEPHAMPPPENVTPRNPSGIPNDLRSLGLDAACKVIEICHKDSKDVNVVDLDRIIDEIANHPEITEIRISMGTDALMECETYIEMAMQRRGLATGRTVLFVASMEPLANQSAHAWKTLRVAVESAGQHPAGFYVIGDERSQVTPVTNEDMHIGTYHLAKDRNRRQFVYAATPFRS